MFKNVSFTYLKVGILPEKVAQAHVCLVWVFFLLLFLELNAPFMGHPLSDSNDVYFIEIQKRST